MNTFTHYCDPSHGWIKAPLSLVKELGISGLISSYSYVRGDYVYLEEDCDASLLFNSLDRLGKPWKVDTRHTNRRSKIRGYSRYAGGV